MSKVTWDKIGERLFETGVDRGVLYLPNAAGEYVSGFAWNGLTTVTESPSGAEPSAQYADNIKYLTLLSAEEFAATIEAFTYPDSFAECDGTAAVVGATGLMVGQQNRKKFGLAFRTRVGNDLAGVDHAYKLHLLYGGQAAPSEKAYATINDSPEAISFSWEISTSPVDVPGLKPAALLTIDSIKAVNARLTALEAILYGRDADAAATPAVTAAAPRLPFPAEVISLLSA